MKAKAQGPALPSEYSQLYRLWLAQNLQAHTEKMLFLLGLFTLLLMALDFLLLDPAHATPLRPWRLLQLGSAGAAWALERFALRARPWWIRGRLLGQALLLLGHFGIGHALLTWWPESVLTLKLTLSLLFTLAFAHWMVAKFWQLQYVMTLANLVGASVIYGVYELPFYQYLALVAVNTLCFLLFYTARREFVQLIFEKFGRYKLVMPMKGAYQRAVAEGNSPAGPGYPVGEQELVSFALDFSYPPGTSVATISSDWDHFFGQLSRALYQFSPHQQHYLNWAQQLVQISCYRDQLEHSQWLEQLGQLAFYLAFDLPRELKHPYTLVLTGERAWVGPQGPIGHQKFTVLSPSSRQLYTLLGHSSGALDEGGERDRVWLNEFLVGAWRDHPLWERAIEGAKNQRKMAEHLPLDLNERKKLSRSA